MRKLLLTLAATTAVVAGALSGANATTLGAGNGLRAAIDTTAADPVTYYYNYYPRRYWHRHHHWRWGHRHHHYRSYHWY